MSALTRKLLRTIKSTRGQFVALVAIVMLGVIVYISMSTAFFNLSRSQQVFYQENDFADYFFHVVKAPEVIVKQIEAVPGVVKATGRIQEDVPVVKENDERATARLTSYPLPMDKELNRLHLLSGRLFSSEEGVLVDPKYAEANGIEPGDSIEIVAEGKKVSLTVVGTATSPEFIYPLKDASNPYPDPKSFGIIMISHEEAKQVLNMPGQINQVVIKLAPGADAKEVERKVEKILEPYGSLISYPRKDQLSHAAVQAEIDGLELASRYMPMIFFVIAAGVQVILLGRLIKSQWLQIATMKAIGYENRQIMLHYTGYALSVTTAGAVLGIGIGIVLASAISDIYAMFFNLPKTIGGVNGKAVAISLVLSTLTGLISGISASWRIITLSPAQGMRPEPPKGGSKIIIEGWKWLWQRLHSSWKMSLRSIFRNRTRFAITVLGVASAAAILLLALFFNDAVDYMMGRYFSGENSYDYLVNFTQPVKADEISSWSRWEGVQRVEPMLQVPVKFYAPGAGGEEGKSEDNVITGLSRTSQLKRVFNEKEEVIPIPEEGILINERTAMKLDLKVGDKVKVETKMSIGPSREACVKVVGINQQLMMVGGAFASLDTASEILNEGQIITGAMLKVDPLAGDEVEKRLNDMTGVASVVSKEKEKDNIMQLMDSMIYFIGIMVLFALVLGLAIVYNSSVMSFNERKRELASLRIIGLMRNEVSGILFKEILLQSLVGIAVGLPAGRVLGEMYIAAVSTDLYTMPVVIYPQTYLLSAVIAVSFVVIGHFFTVNRVKKLELVEVMKNQD